MDGLRHARRAGGDHVGGAVRRLGRGRDLEEVLAVPRNRISQPLEGRDLISEPRDRHRKPQIRILGVRLAPVFTDPGCDRVELAIDIAEAVGPQDRVVSPRLGLARLALEIDAVALAGEGKQPLDRGLGRARRRRRFVGPVDEASCPGSDWRSPVIATMPVQARMVTKVSART